MKRLISFCALVSILLSLNAQDIVDYSKSSTTRPFRVSPFIPTQCKVGDFYFNNGSSPGTLYYCDPVNAWNVLGAGSGVTAAGAQGDFQEKASGGGLAAAPLHDDGANLTVTGRNVSIGTTVPGGAPPNSFAVAGNMYGALQASYVAQNQLPHYDYYVDSVAGSDLNPGTQSSPFATWLPVLTVNGFAYSENFGASSYWNLYRVTQSSSGITPPIGGPASVTGGMD